MHRLCDVHCALCSCLLPKVHLPPPITCVSSLVVTVTFSLSALIRASEDAGLLDVHVDGLYSPPFNITTSSKHLYLDNYPFAPD